MGNRGLGPAVLPSDTSQNAQAFLDFFRDTGINVDGRVIAGTDGPVLKAALDAVESMKKDYGSLLSDLKGIQVGGRVNTLAATNGRDLKINTAYFGDTNTLDLVYQRSVASGFHPKGTTWKDIVVHEMGHAVVYGITKKIHNGDTAKIAADWARGTTASNIVHSAMEYIKENFKSFGFSKKPAYGEMRRAISTYATKNYHETVAEAWADYHANGTKAQPLSQAIYQAMSRYF